MYLTDVGKLAHKVQIKEGFQHLSKNAASGQIVHHFGLVHAVSMQLLTLCARQARKAEGAGALVDDKDLCFSNELTNTPNPFQLTETEATRPSRLFRGHNKNINDLKQLLPYLDIPVDLIFIEQIYYSQRSLENADRLTGKREWLETMPVERFKQWQLPVLAFQESDFYDIHLSQTTGEG